MFIIVVCKYGFDTLCACYRNISRIYVHVLPLVSDLSEVRNETFAWHIVMCGPLQFSRLLIMSDLINRTTNKERQTRLCGVCGRWRLTVLNYCRQHWSVHLVNRQTFVHITWQHWNPKYICIGHVYSARLFPIVVIDICALKRVTRPRVIYLHTAVMYLLSV